jgi:hypothetical protein
MRGSGVRGIEVWQQRLHLDPVSRPADRPLARSALPPALPRIPAPPGVRSCPFRSLYACDGCGATHKRSLLRRAPVAAIDPERLDAYHRNDPARAWAHAFEIATHEPLPHRVEWPALPASGTLLARIEQPFACGLRWDRFLAAELGWSRARVAAAWREGALSIDTARALADRVADGATLRVTLP